MWLLEMILLFILYWLHAVSVTELCWKLISVTQYGDKCTICTHQRIGLWVMTLTLTSEVIDQAVPF